MHRTPMHRTRSAIFVVGCIAAATCARGDVIGSDGFEGDGLFISRFILPDTASGSPPGTFASSDFDVFGIIDRTVNNDFEDDTFAQATDGTPGMFASTKTDRVRRSRARDSRSR